MDDTKRIATRPRGGWVKLYRSIQENPLWLEKPFSRGQAWVDLILLANSKGGIIHRRGIRINVQRGEVGYSLRELGNRWGWSLGKVQRFLDELKIDTQINTRTDTENVSVTSLICLTNYGKYQASDTKNDTENDTATGTKTGTEQEGKEINPICLFSTFWKSYPRKQKKAAALKAWGKLKPDSILQGQILDALAWQTQQPDWLKDGGKYIPHAASWLNGRRWEDEQTTPKRGQVVDLGYYR